MSIVDPVSNIKLTDKVRANSVIACKSVIENERIEYDFDGKEESWQFLAERVFEHIEEWYRSFETEVKEKYGSLEKNFLRNKEKYPKQAALVYIHEERYPKAKRFKKCESYFITETCIGCGSCAVVCPQNCIIQDEVPFVIEQEHCLHCGNCMMVCPVDAVERR